MDIWSNKKVFIKTRHMQVNKTQHMDRLRLGDRTHMTMNPNEHVQHLSDTNKGNKPKYEVTTCNSCVQFKPANL